MNILTLFSEFSTVLTKRTHENLNVLLRGAILASDVRTVTACLRSAWPWVTRHFSSYENVLRRAVINEREMTRLMFRMILRLIPEDSVIELIVDETLIRRYGPYVCGVSLHRDKILSTRSQTRITPGNMWIVLAFAVKLPFMENVIALPVLSALYISSKRGKPTRIGLENKKHRTPSELAKLMILTVRRWVPDRRFRVIGDAWYASHELADMLNEKSARCPNGTLVSRFRWDARLHADPGNYSGFGRPRIIGERISNPRQMADDKNANWELHEITWYGGESSRFMLLSGDGLWYRCSQGATWVRWVIVRGVDGNHREEIFFTTDKTLSPSEIVECYVRRWSIEVTFEEARCHLGIETLRNRSYNAIHRSVPMLLSLYSLIAVWFASYGYGVGTYSNEAPWYKKKYVTFSDMLKTARFDILSSSLFPLVDLSTCEFQVAPFPLNIIYSMLLKKREAA